MDLTSQTLDKARGAFFFFFLNLAIGPVQLFQENKIRAQYNPNFGLVGLAQQTGLKLPVLNDTL